MAAEHGGLEVGEPVPGGHRAPPGSPPFPGAIAVSHLRVYDTEAGDGLPGGTPHCHTACTEAYVVVAGEGRVHTLGADGFRETLLRPGAFVWFTPGTIHRLVNDGDLEIVVLMQNAGLPEAGDMVMTFPDDVLADPDRYAAAASLPAATVGEGGAEATRRRRDLAVEGFRALQGEADQPAALARFHRQCAVLVRSRIPAWRDVWAAGPAAAAAATARQLDALAAGDVGALGAASVAALPPPPEDRRWGCCGTLGTYLPAAR